MCLDKDIENTKFYFNRKNYVNCKEKQEKQ